MTNWEDALFDFVVGSGDSPLHSERLKPSMGTVGMGHGAEHHKDRAP